MPEENQAMDVTAEGQLEDENVAAGVGNTEASVSSDTQTPVQAETKIVDKKSGRWRWWLIGGLLLIVIGGLAAYLTKDRWWPEEKTTVTTKQTLPEEMTVLLTGDAISGIYPSSQPEVYETKFQRNIFQTLTQVEADGRAVGLLAESWTNPSPTVWLFNLRSEAVFSNNEPVLAKDVVFSITEAMAHEWPGADLPLPIAKVEVAAERQVRITTEGVDPILLNELAQLLIINKEHYEQKDADELAIGSGPYVVEAVNELDDGGKAYVLVANEHYYLVQPEVKRLTALSQTEEADRVEYGLKHNASVILANSLTDEQADQLKEKGYVLSSSASNTVNLMGFDTIRDKSPYITGVADNPLKKLAVRQALYRAINLTELAKNPPDASWTIANQLAPVSVFGHDPALKTPSYSIAAAKKLMAEAGYPNGFGLTIDMPAPMAEQVEEAVKNWKDIGVTVKINPLGLSEGMPKLIAHDTSAFYIGWELGTYDFASSFAGLIEKDNQVNFGQYSLSSATALQQELTTTVNLEQRKTKLQQLQKVLLDDVAYIPIWFSSDVHAVKSDINFVDAYPAHWTAR